MYNGGDSRLKLGGKKPVVLKWCSGACWCALRDSQLCLSKLSNITNYSCFHIRGHV